MLNFCTLFDSNYIDRGLLMYESLSKVLNKFHLYIIAFDVASFNTLNKLNLKNVTVISLKEFEDNELKKVKETRSKVEYMWTCSSSSILYCIKKFNLSSCTYIDADLYFYSSPKKLIDEMKNKSVLITEHNYTKKYDQSKISGKYCVQFMTFKNDDCGIKILNWWRNACIDWCYAKPEDGKFGDQKYLDDWIYRFDCVHVLENIGGGVAPWNMQQYSVNNKIFIKKENSSLQKLVFFHFHGIKIIGNKIDLCSYYLPREFLENIYYPYIKELFKTRERLRLVNPKLFSNFNVPKPNLKDILVIFKRRILNEYNVLNKKLIM